MAVPPPLDEITKLPAIGVDIIQQQFNKLVEQTLDATKEVITESTKLPKSIKCDDPRIENIISIVKTVITTAQSIKAAIAVAQLSNPATVAQYIAAQAEAVQDELIANAVAAVIPLQAVPIQTLSKLETLVPPLLAAIAKLNRACDEDIELDIPNLSDGSGIDDVDDVDDYNDLLSSEFYRDVNVSEPDLVQRSNR